MRFQINQNNNIRKNYKKDIFVQKNNVWKNFIRIKIKKLIFLFIFVFFIIIFIISFSISKNNIYLLLGSTTLQPFLEDLIAHVENEQDCKSKLSFAVSAGGSTQGLNYLLKDLTNASSESRFPKDDEYEAKNKFNNIIWEKKKISSFLFGYDFIIFVANIDIKNLNNKESQGFLPNVKNTSLWEIFNKIYAGKYNNWHQIDSSLPNLQITPINRELGSGTRSTVYNAFAAISPNNSSKASEFPKYGIIANSNGQVTSDITSTKGSIGYVSFRYLINFYMNNNKLPSSIWFLWNNSVFSKNFNIQLEPYQLNNFNKNKSIYLQHFVTLTKNNNNNNYLGNSIYPFFHPMLISYSILNNKNSKKNWLYLYNNLLVPFITNSCFHTWTENEGYLPIIIPINSNNNNCLDNNFKEYYFDPSISNQNNVLQLNDDKGAKLLKWFQKSDYNRNNNLWWNWYGLKYKNL